MVTLGKKTLAQDASLLHVYGYAVIRAESLVKLIRLINY